MLVQIVNGNITINIAKIVGCYLKGNRLYVLVVCISCMYEYWWYTIDIFFQIKNVRNYKEWREITVYFWFCCLYNFCTSLFQVNCIDKLCYKHSIPQDRSSSILVVNSVPRVNRALGMPGVPGWWHCKFCGHNEISNLYHDNIILF